MTKVSRKKQLQRLKPVEDERKLQTISIIEGLNRKVKTFFVCVEQIFYPNKAIIFVDFLFNVCQIKSILFYLFSFAFNILKL